MRSVTLALALAMHLFDANAWGGIPEAFRFCRGELAPKPEMQCPSSPAYNECLKKDGYSDFAYCIGTVSNRAQCEPQRSALARCVERERIHKH